MPAFCFMLYARERLVTHAAARHIGRAALTRAFYRSKSRARGESHPAGAIKRKKVRPHFGRRVGETDERSRAPSRTSSYRSYAVIALF